MGVDNVAIGQRDDKTMDDGGMECRSDCSEPFFLSDMTTPTMDDDDDSHLPAYLYR